MTDILNHRIDVYSELAASLVRGIVNLADERTRRELGNHLYRDFNPYGSPDVQKLEIELIDLRDRLAAEARDRDLELRDE